MTQKIISLDSQLLTDIQSCALKMKYKFIENLRSEDTDEAIEKGDMMHKMLEPYYGLKSNCTRPNSELFTQLREEGFFNAYPLESLDSVEKIIEFSIQVGIYVATKKDLPIEEVEETVYQFREYTSHYQFEALETLAVEEVGAKLLYEDEEYKIIYVYKVDRLCKQGNLLIPMDHKTTKRNSSVNNLDNQFRGYCWAFNTDHIIINKIGFQKTLSRSERFLRHSLIVDSELRAEWVKNTVFWAKMYDYYLENQIFPFNLTSCMKYNKMCRFSKLCEANPDSRETIKDRNFVIVESWDPAKELERIPE